MLRFTKFSKRKKRRDGVDWQEASDIKKRAIKLIRTLKIGWLNTSQLHFFRSFNSTSRAYARIWGLSKIWQKALNVNASYIIEVLSEHYDKLPDREKDKVLLHEIAHIPKNFSGSLLPHIRRRGKRNFHERVEDLYAQYLKMSKNNR